jgi:hypothetical protein
MNNGAKGPTVTKSITNVDHWPTKIKVSATGGAWQFYKIGLETPTGDIINVAKNTHGLAGCDSHWRTRKSYTDTTSCTRH